MFHEVRFPIALSFGSVGGPERKTEIVALASGFEERNAPWAQSRRHYDAGISLRGLDDVEALIAFFEARKGRLYGFRWKDWADYKSCLPSKSISFDDQVIARGNGVETIFQLQKTYVSGPSSHARPIRKPVRGTVKVGMEGVELSEGVEFEADITTGEIAFAVAPYKDAVVTAGFEFDVPVRFDTDLIQTSLASFRAGEVPNVPVVEVRI